METHKNTADRQAVPLTSDLVFKYVFGTRHVPDRREERADTEHSTRYLRSLLSAIQEDAGYPAVASVRIANPFNLKDTDDGKLSVVDVRATDVCGTTFTIEAQSANHQAFGSRALYYWARTYGAQLREGDFYTRLAPVVGINLLDFRFFPEGSGAPLHTTFVPSCVQKPTLPPSPDLVLHFLELPQYNQHNARTSTALEQWMSIRRLKTQFLYRRQFITRRGRPDAMEDPVMKQILEESPEIAEADHRYEEFVADEQLRSRLDARDKFIRTQAQLMHDAEQKGLEKGREEEREKRRETARKMKQDGLSTTDIARYTDLPEEEIQEL
ncbi:MAG: Rpn family recombination-promoting nuclease/putative transposase [Spirochaeta sp.]|jgi:predicted transposase/invertase (TIGR01784 family)|nr:Rpn family recombination-promoting nuclease/putative transposase [Spirochaeta sp.]